MFPKKTEYAELLEVQCSALCRVFRRKLKTKKRLKNKVRAEKLSKAFVGISLEIRLRTLNRKTVAHPYKIKNTSPKPMANLPY